MYGRAKKYRHRSYSREIKSAGTGSEMQTGVLILIFVYFAFYIIADYVSPYSVV